jgi:hypothetical protein
MGLKRKASSLECDYAYQQQQPFSPPSMTFSSTTSSPDSMITEPFHTTSAYHLPITSNAPWLHSRTRKRVRDNRPDESQIHSDTVRKLFEAQKPHHSQEDAMMMDTDDFYQHHSLPTPPMEVEEEMIEDPTSMDAIETVAATDLLVPEANQRSLHDFFRRHQQDRQPNELPTTPPAIIESTVPLYTQQILFTTRPPTQQEIAAGAPAPVLRQRSSMGVLGEINTPPPSRDEQHETDEVQPAFTGGVLACGFRSKVEIEAGLFGGIGVDVGAGGDAMVMG